VLTEYSLPKASRSQHIQTCIRWDIASRFGHLQKDVHYCHHCFSWVIGEDWDPHCTEHLATLATTRCGTVTHCHTLMRPGYCPFCMADEKTLTGPERLQSWTRDHQLWGHVEEHLKVGRWPRECPHPLCGTSIFEDAAAFRFHLVDEHQLSRTRPEKPSYSAPPSKQPNANLPDSGTLAVSLSRKRKQPISPDTVQWVPWQNIDDTHIVTEEVAFCLAPKRRQHSPPAISPMALSLKQDLGVGHAACRVKPSAMHSDPYLSGTESDKTLIEDKYNSPAPRCASPDCPGWPPAPEDDGDDMLFSQYLRSPSPSPAPSPDDTASESSGTTLFDFPPRQTCGSPGLSSMTAASVVRKQSATREGEPCHVHTIPRIRLRVNQPKITLRLSCPDASQSTGNKTSTTKGQGKRYSRRKSKDVKPKQARGKRRRAKGTVIRTYT